MTLTTNIIFCVLCGFYFTNAVKQLPSYFPKCYRNDPPAQLNECMLKATEEVKPYLIKGVPELNIPSITPFTIPKVTLQQGTDALNFEATLEDIVVSGLENYHFTNYELDLKNARSSSNVELGQLFLKSDYKITGKILAVNIDSKGILFANISHASANFVDQAETVTRNGVTYLEPKDISVKLKLGDVQGNFEGPNGNDDLTSTINKVVTDNLPELVAELTPAIEQVLEKILKDLILKSIFKVPLENLYPLRET